MSAADFSAYHLTQFFTSLGQLSAESDETKPLLPTSQKDGIVSFWICNISIKPLMEIINIIAWDLRCFLLCCHVPFFVRRVAAANLKHHQRELWSQRDIGVCVGVCVRTSPLTLRLLFNIESFQNKVKFSKVSLQRWSNSHITNGDGWQGQWIQISVNCGGSYCHCLSIAAFELAKICSVHSVKWRIQLNALEFMIFSQG